MGREDRRDNRVTVHTPTLRPTQQEHGSLHVRRDGRRDENATVLKKIALPIAHVVALVCCGNDEIVCLKNRHDVTRRGQSRWCVLHFTLITIKHVWEKNHISIVISKQALHYLPSPVCILTTLLK